MGLRAMEKVAEGICGLRGRRRQQEHEVNRLMGCFTICSRVQLKCDGTGWLGGEVKGKLVNGVGTLHTTLEHVSSITTADVHTLAASSLLN